MNRGWTAAEKRYAKSLGKWIRETREKLGMSHSDVAEVLGMHRNTIWRWESGSAMPNPYQLHLMRQWTKGPEVKL